MRTSQVIKCILFLGVFLFAKCQSDADIDRKTKATACIFLLKAALFHDGDEYFPRVLKNLEFSSTEDLTSKWTEKALINCFNTVSLIKSADLINRRKPERISPLAKDNKEILSLKNYNSKYTEDPQRLVKDSERLRKTLGELKSEFSELELLARNYARTTYNNKRKEEQQEAKINFEEEKQETGSYENGRLNISLVTKMDPNLKLAIGFGLILVFVIFFMWGYNALTKGKETKKTKQK